MKLKFFLAAGALLIATGLQARHIPTLEEAVGRGLIKTQPGLYPNWMPDGERYSRIERRADGKQEIAAYSAKDNSRSVVVPAEALVNPATGKQIPVRSFALSPDGKKALIYTNSKQVWRLDTRGDYWIVDIANNTARQIGKDRPESSLMFAKFSPNGEKVAYVSGNNLYVEDVQTGNTKQLTNDGSNTIVNGTFDWVYEEEFSCRDGFRWSPDSETIAYWQSDTDGTGWFDIINNVDSLYSFNISFPYPKAGTPNSAVKVGYVSANGGPTTWIDIPGDPRNNYIPRMEWIPGSNELFIQQMNRPQNTNKVWVVAVGETQPTNIFTDTDKAWVETNDKVHWLNGNKEFTWLSEKDGYRQLYVVSRDGKQMRKVTKGDFDFINEVGLDAKNGIIYFIASPDNFTQRYLYKADLKKGTTERVSPADQEGTHTYNMSPSGKWAVHSFHNAATPPMWEMVSFPQNKSVRLITDNAEAKRQYDELGLNSKEFFKVKSGDLILDGWMIKPADFDPSKKYPLIIEVYGEPASSTVTDSWGGGDLWNQYMANQGYIVASIDNRGANAPRGREWRKCIYGEVGTFASEDQARGVQDLARQYSFIDPERVGITGWSGGGSQTLNSMFRYPDVFSTGIAIAFVADQKLYDTIYQERYMNTPQANPEGYRKGSPINYVEGLKGNLLLIHGTGDDNVHYQNCERLVNELVKHGKTFYQISYPMRSHSISEREGTSLHLRQTMADYWKKNLPAGGR